jgi:hypothetical protein
VHELVTDGTSGPTASQHRLVPIEILPAHATEAGFNPEQHRFPFTTGFSYTHSGGSIAGQPAGKQAKVRRYLTLLRGTRAQDFRTTDTLARQSNRTGGIRTRSRLPFDSSPILCYSPRGSPGLSRKDYLLWTLPNILNGNVSRSIAFLTSQPRRLLYHQRRCMGACAIA